MTVYGMLTLCCRCDVYCVMCRVLQCTVCWCYVVGVMCTVWCFAVHVCLLSSGCVITRASEVLYFIIYFIVFAMKQCNSWLDFYVVVNIRVIWQYHEYANILWFYHCLQKWWSLMFDVISGVNVRSHSMLFVTWLCSNIWFC